MNDCKAQLIELEQNAGHVRAQGLGLAAISYDSVAVLRQFAARARMSIPLLSDPDSAVICRFRILNGAVAKDGVVFGIPYPGTYLVDQRGIVTAKFFQQNYGVRDTAASILLRQFGLKAPKQETISAKHAQLRAWVSNSEIRPGQRVTLSLDAALPRRVHIYAPGVRGYKPTVLKLSESPAFRGSIPAACRRSRSAPRNRWNRCSTRIVNWRSKASSSTRPATTASVSCPRRFPLEMDSESQAVRPDTGAR